MLGNVKSLLYQLLSAREMTLSVPEMLSAATQSFAQAGLEQSCFHQGFNWL
jgi:hypothetical protein